MQGLAWGHARAFGEQPWGAYPGSQGMCKVSGERDIHMETEDEWDLVRHMGKEGAEEKEVRDLSGSDPVVHLQN